MLLLALVCSAGGAAAYAPIFDAFGEPGGDEQKCSGAQLVVTKTALCVWGICGGGAGVVNRSVWLRKSTDWGVTWRAPQPQPHLGAQDLGQFIYDPKTDTILSMGPPPGLFPWGGPCRPRPGCHRPYSCMSKSTNSGDTWTAATPVGCHSGNHTGETNEGCGGVALSNGDILAPAGSQKGGGNFVIISSAEGGSNYTRWLPGNATPPLPSKQGWGEAMVAELANGSVVLTSRLSGVRKVPHWEFLPIQRGFSISHTGGRTWAKSWSFPADQPFDVNFGPGYVRLCLLGRVSAWCLLCGGWLVGGCSLLVCLHVMCGGCTTGTTLSTVWHRRTIEPSCSSPSLRQPCMATHPENVRSAALIRRAPAPIGEI